MAAADHTRHALAKTLKEMAQTMPISRIRVVELCRRCGVDRRTFYYHFRDIYDLTAWIYDETVEESVARCGGRICREALIEALTRVREDESFFRCALSEDSQNALGRYILRYLVELYRGMLIRRMGVESLTEEEMYPVGYHCFGSVGMVRRWILSDNAWSPEEFAAMLIENMPPVLRELYEEETACAANAEQQEGGEAADEG